MRLIAYTLQWTLSALLAAAAAFHVHAAEHGGRPAPESPASVTLRWNEDVLERPASWYGGEAARTLAANVLRWQSAEGGWPKNIDLSQPATEAAIAAAVEADRANTIDNGATLLPMRFLARVAAAGGGSRLETAFIRGLDYLFAAQYPNGGWPQYYPLREGYYSRITFNDDAMTNVLFLMRDIANGAAEFGFVDGKRRSTATAALARGTDVILATQLRQDGKRTGWCAQYDQVTLAPAWARAYEPPSLSGMETVGVVRFLMGIENPSEAQVTAIEAAVAWLDSVAIYGLDYRRVVDAEGNEDGIVVAEPGAGPIWARFYDLHTNRPIFTGRDSVIHYSLDELEQERRGGYGYYGSWAASLLDEEYPRWRDRLSH